ncbi:MAG: amidohydrolase family protein, partial [Firmicutes bacterium]|nr:amidohydrolase family protein [Bacillota bacterium]
MSQSTLYINGIIYTMDEANTCVSAMLVTDGRIAAIGSTDELLAIKPEKTEIVDLNNQVILPGLVDCHAHVGITGRRLFELELTGKSKEEILNAVKQRASELQPGEWICGMGWNQENWEEKVFPTKEDLDAVAPDHPVKLTRYCGNAFWCNSLAIELAMNDTSHDVEN